VVVEDNTFNATHMSAILLENDARGWFESGCVRDMTIRNNRFLRCAEPVININPQNGAPNKAVHQNIRIEGNHFALRDKVSVKGQSTTGLTVTGNTGNTVYSDLGDSGSGDRRGLTVTGNTVYSDPVADDASPVIIIIDCTDVEVGDNIYLPLSKWRLQTK